MFPESTGLCHHPTLLKALMQEAVARAETLERLVLWMPHRWSDMPSERRDMYLRLVLSRN